MNTGFDEAIGWRVIIAWFDYPIYSLLRKQDGRWARVGWKGDGLPRGWISGENGSLWLGQALGGRKDRRGASPARIGLDVECLTG